MKRLPLFLTVSCLLFALSANAEEASKKSEVDWAKIPYKVNLDLAHALVRTGTGLDYKEGLIDQSSAPNEDGFYVMHGKNAHGYHEDNAGNRAPIYEWYAVNAWTGDVWTVGRCQRLSNPSLHEPLARIKALFNDNELKDYERLRIIPAYRINVRTVGPDIKKVCREAEDVDYSEMGTAIHESVPYKVNANTASALVESALREHKKDVGFDSFETPDENGFFSADLIASYGEGIAGRYDINAWTGDIWDEFSCKRISNSEVQKIQLKIKKQFKDNDLKYYQHLHDMRAHGVDLEPCP